MQEIQATIPLETKDQTMQTGDEKDCSKNELLEEAMLLFNKHNNKLKTSCISGLETNREVFYSIYIHDFIKIL